MDFVMKTIAMAELTNLTRSAGYNGRQVWQLQLNGCELSVGQMPVFFSSLRPDFPPWRDSHCLCYEWRLVKSERRELVAGISATRTSHPFSWSSPFRAPDLY